MDTFSGQGSSGESARFETMQARLSELREKGFPNPGESLSVVVVSGLSMASEVLSCVASVHHHEERMLFMLALPRLPSTNVVYLTRQPIATIIDYYLNLLPGIPGSHARERSTHQGVVSI